MTNPTRKEKIRRLKVVRALVEKGVFVLPEDCQELADKVKGIANWIRNWPPTNIQLEAVSAAYLCMSPALRAEGDGYRTCLIKAARRNINS